VCRRNQDPGTPLANALKREKWVEKREENRGKKIEGKEK
jgi:hypothetical protein